MSCLTRSLFLVPGGKTANFEFAIHNVILRASNMRIFCSSDRDVEVWFCSGHQCSSCQLRCQCSSCSGFAHVEVAMFVPCSSCQCSLPVFQSPVFQLASSGCQCSQGSAGFAFVGFQVTAICFPLNFVKQLFSISNFLTITSSGDFSSK